MDTEGEARWFAAEKARYETSYLIATDPRGQSGFGRSEADWDHFRRPVAAAIHRSGAFLDVGCANGLLLESVVRWAAEAGHVLEPYGVDFSERLVDLARRRLPHLADRFFVGNALLWQPPHAFDFVRTELVYVPRQRRRDYIEHLLDCVVTDDGRLILCSYGSSRPEGERAELLLDQLTAWNHDVAGVADVVSP